MAASYTLTELAEHLKGRLVGDPTHRVSGLGSLEHAGAAEASHFSNPAYRSALAGSRAGVVVLREEDLSDWHGNAIVVPNPYLAFARLSQLFDSQDAASPGVHPSAVVDPAARVDPSARLGPGVVVGPRTTLGRDVTLGPNVAIGADCSLGAGCRVDANAVLYDRVQLGPRCVVHAGAVLGGAGFGFAPDEAGHLVPIAQLGGLRIGADVRIGAATTIDRGALEDTVIADGVKIDNQVQIGHNCEIGAHSVICGCVGLVGSTRIGRHCVLAGGVGIGGGAPITLCDGVTVSGMTHVSASISEPGVYSGGVLHAPSRSWKRNALRLGKLDGLFRRVAALERRLRS